MKLLLDTHALLWFLADDPQLSEKSAQHIESLDHVKYVSVAALWEITLKLGNGKLSLTGKFDEVFPASLERNGFEVLPAELPHLSRLLTMPFHHRDPFDRLQIAQAAVEGMTIVTRDPEFPKYGVPTLW